MVIIGGGVIGLAIARALGRRGLRDLIVIEKNQFGREASWAAGGILAPQVEADRADDFFRLARASRDLYRGFATALQDETAIDVELDTTGTLYLAFTEAQEKELRARYAWQQSEGLEVEWLDDADARRLEPNLSDEVRCALRFPNDFQIENRRLVEALVSANQKAGARMLAHTEVTSIAIEQQRVTGVETSRGFIGARVVVLAAGAWSSTVDLPVRIAVRPIRGQMLCFKTESQFARHVIYSSRGYLIPRRNRRLLAGSTNEDVGFEKRVTDGGVSEIKSMAREIMPALIDLPLADSWAGFRPRTADGLPVLGPSRKTSGLFYATGHYRNGILLAPITGELIGEAIAAGNSSPLLQAFSPDRLCQKPEL